MEFILPYKLDIVILHLEKVAVFSGIRQPFSFLLLSRYVPSWLLECIQNVKYLEMYGIQGRSFIANLARRQRRRISFTGAISKPVSYFPVFGCCRRKSICIFSKQCLNVFMCLLCKLV